MEMRPEFVVWGTGSSSTSFIGSTSASSPRSGLHLSARWQILLKLSRYTRLLPCFFDHDRSSFPAYDWIESSHGKGSDQILYRIQVPLSYQRAIIFCPWEYDQSSHELRRMGDSYSRRWFPLLSSNEFPRKRHAANWSPTKRFPCLFRLPILILPILHSFSLSPFRFPHNVEMCEGRCPRRLFWCYECVVRLLVLYNYDDVLCNLRFDHLSAVSLLVVFVDGSAQCAGLRPEFC